MSNIVYSYKSKDEAERFNEFLKTGSFCIVYDTETTGLNWETDRIIQLYALICLATEDKLIPISGMEWYINPGFELPSFITELTGITDEKLSAYGTEDEYIDSIADMFSTYPVIGYNNTRYDDFLMDRMFKRHGKEWNPTTSYDALIMAKETFPPGVLENHKLITVATALGADQYTKKFHNAQGDVMATLSVTNALCHAQRGMASGKIKAKFELPKKTIGEIIPEVQNTRFWVHQTTTKNGTMLLRRLYVAAKSADVSFTLFLDVDTMQWKVSDSEFASRSSVNIGELNMPEFIKKVCEKLGCSTEEEIPNLCPKK